MVCATLDDDIAGANGDFPNIDEQRYLAFEHDSVVNGFSPMHVGMARVTRVGGRAFRAYFRELRPGLGGIQIRCLGRFRWDIEHSDSRAARGWSKNDAFLLWLAAGMVDLRGSLTGVPNLVERGAARAREGPHSLWRRIRLDDGASLRVVPGDNAAEIARHSCSPRIL